MDGYFDLGNYTRQINTKSADCQTWFNRGLLWTYGFNHVEADFCFRQALNADETCAMAHWGIAFTNGPYINKPWKYYGEKELPDTVALCHKHTQLALTLSETESAENQALITALGERYKSADFTSLPQLENWINAFAIAMRKACQQFPDDLDINALTAEALMMRFPWKLWDVPKGIPYDYADTLEIMEILEHGQAVSQAQGEKHPGILHMYIHTLEMAPEPERALRAADELRNLSPDGGHLLHMPSHIYRLCGHFNDALAVSLRSVTADKKYLDYKPDCGFYLTAICHDLHQMMYSAMFLGQLTPARFAAERITEIVTDDILHAGPRHKTNTLEGYYAMGIHVLVRFGLWQEIVDKPMPADPDLFVITTVMHHYAKAIAHATLGQFDDADAQRTAFYTSLATVPAERLFFNNYAINMLAVAAAMMDGEIQYHKGNYTIAFDYLRKAVQLDDDLYYTEPWAWMHPPRHALGALLLAQGHVVEAEKVYRADLGIDPVLPRACMNPNNVWGLHGYVECLRTQDKQAELALIEPNLTIALARTDFELTSSCCCRAMTTAPSCCT